MVDPEIVVVSFVVDSEVNKEVDDEAIDEELEGIVLFCGTASATFTGFLDFWFKWELLV